jgi:integrase
MAGKIGDDLHAKLAKAGLVTPRQPAKQLCLGPFLDSYITGRTDLKDRTRMSLHGARNRLVQYFKADRPLGEISAGDAEDWQIWLKTQGYKGKPYGKATVSRTLVRAKQFFRFAVKKKLITENPFDDIKPGSQVNEERKFFVEREVAYRVLEACPDAEWRLLFALSRFRGLRCPSEHFSLLWADVAWERNRFLVRSPKTEHHEGGAARCVPIFPELRPYLQAAWDLAPEGAVHVIAKYRDTDTNLRTRLSKIIRRAGLKPWPKLFHNLRASRETELAKEYPIHVVCDWIGNDAMIAKKHYLQVTDDYFERAAKGGAPTARTTSQHQAATPRVTSQESEQGTENCGAVQEVAAGCKSLPDNKLAGHGLEAGCRPLRSGAAGLVDDGPPQHRQGPRRRHHCPRPKTRVPPCDTAPAPSLG